MRVGIIGGGSIGLLFGAKLAEAGADVTIWTRTEDQSAAITSAGIRLIDGQRGERIVRASGEWLSDDRLTAASAAKVASEGIRPVDWYLLALKQTDLTTETVDRIGRLLRLTPGHPDLLCLQNGIGHMGKLTAAAAGYSSVYNAVTSVGAKREDVRSVRHTGEGQLFIASASAPEAVIRQKMLLGTLIRAGFDASLSNDIHNRVYQKLLVNAVINPLTALFDIQNGELPGHPARRSLMKALHEETVTVLRAAGMDEWPDSWEGVLSVCERTSLNVSSMLADIRAGRRTEIASINGEIVRLAAAMGMQAPINESVLRLVEELGGES